MLVHEEITEPIYGSALTVIAGDRDEFTVWARRREPKRKWRVGKNTEAMTYTFDDPWRVWVYLPTAALAEPTHLRAGIIAHEALHYVGRILNPKDLPCCPESEEAWAYLLGYAVAVITRVLVERWFKRRKRGHQRKRRTGKTGNKTGNLPDAGGRKKDDEPPPRGRAYRR